jgi:perosamine synthetase
VSDSAGELTLRLAAPGDESVLLAWANDPAVREASFNSDPIDAATHSRWYAERLASPDTAFFIGERDGQRVGYARVERWSADAGEIAASVDAPLRGQGFGARLIALAAEHGAAELGVGRVIAHVKGDNEASLNAFLAAGFARLDAGRGGEAIPLAWPSPVLVPHSRPWVGEQEAQAAATAVRSRTLAQGPRNAELETHWCELTGNAEAAAVASGVGGLRLALHALGVGAGDEVLMPAYSCVALLNAALVLGATPVLVDAIGGEWTLDPDDAASRAGPRTKAVIAVNLFGMPARIGDLRSLGVPIVEDCAHGIGGRTDAGPFGAGGDLGVASFYATKMHGAGEGGIVAARDPELIERVRAARDYGDRPPNAQHLNDKMSDVEAAIAVVQLRRMDEALRLRAERAARYDAALAVLADDGLVELPARDSGRTWYRYAVWLPQHESGAVCEWMSARGIRVEQPVWDLSACEYWADGLPATRDAFDHVVSLPLYPDLSDAEQDAVTERFDECLRG